MKSIPILKFSNIKIWSLFTNLFVQGETCCHFKTGTVKHVINIKKYLETLTQQWRVFFKF